MSHALVAHQHVVARVGYHQKRDILEATGNRRRGPVSPSCLRSFISVADSCLQLSETLGYKLYIICDGNPETKDHCNCPRHMDINYIICDGNPEIKDQEDFCCHGLMADGKGVCIDSCSISFREEWLQNCIRPSGRGFFAILVRCPLWCGCLLILWAICLLAKLS